MESVLIADNVSFKNIIEYPLIEIEKEKVTFICGDSGCGKSTLLKLFNGTLSPEKGSLSYCGEDIAQMDTISLRRNVLLVDQSIFLFDQSIKENFDAYYTYRGLKPLKKMEMKEYLTLCCADFPLEKDCLLLSGGERQRVYLAIFLSFMPSVLMMDEPTSALDRDTARQVLTQVLEFCRSKGITSVIVSHDREIVDQFAENKILLEAGRLYATNR